MGVDCKQDNKKDQKKKCKSNWFNKVCVVSCCSTAIVTNPVTNSPVSVPDSNSKCKGLSEPKNAKRPKDKKKFACIQENEVTRRINVRRIGLGTVVWYHVVGFSK